MGSQFTGHIFKYGRLYKGFVPLEIHDEIKVQGARGLGNAVGTGGGLPRQYELEPLPRHDLGNLFAVRRANNTIKALREPGTLEGAHNHFLTA